MLHHGRVFSASLHPTSHRRQFIIEPQEVAFGLLYLLSIIRLAAAGKHGWDFWTQLLLMFCGIAVVVFDQWKQTALSHRLRLFAPIVTMPIVYAAVAPVAALSGSGAALLQRADSVLVGGDLSVRMQWLASAPATELLAVCYIGFFLLIASALWAHGFGPMPRAQFLLRLLGVLYGVGFLGYTLLPAAGPYVEMAGHFSKPLTGWFATDLFHAMMAWGSNRVDCFPSLHCAISGAILLTDWKYDRRRFRWLLAPVAGIWVATVYLRQHYFSDVLAGGILLFLAAKLLWAWLTAIEPVNEPVESINFTKPDDRG